MKQRISRVHYSCTSPNEIDSVRLKRKQRFDGSIYIPVNAPAVLMRLDLAHCAAEIARLGGLRGAKGRERSFYPYFFAPRDAERIVGRLRIH